MKSNYMTRAIAHRDPRFVTILKRLGHRVTDVPATDDLASLRAEYQNIVGKRAFHGWDADALKTKIAEAMQ
ncbi:hypothetical protein D2T31_12020 [Sinirhodobacter populi]|uniref:Uncharacterized protein n=1 Tax=Paenirhodobacter populi TaxID=2306993 RepID=A0A443K7X9_9RHOB|nr:hypothetical protein [Sinirhodobacter populi]RWR28832.1 hypothetical protein D2T31_12020 [Sinirhodobacter populi]